MSLDQSIAQLTTQAGQLLDLPQEIADQAQTQITRIGDRYDAILATQSVSAYVNQSTGDDANQGTSAAPLKTIQAALNLTPQGGSCSVYLQADHSMEVEGDVTTKNKYLVLASADGARHNLTFSEYASDAYAPSLRAMRSFKLNGFNQMTVSGLTVNWPTNDLGGSGLGSVNGGMISINSGRLAIVSCDIFIPTGTPFHLFNTVSMGSLYWASNTIKSGSLPLSGKIHRSYPSTSGTSISNVHELNSNLSAI